MMKPVCHKEMEHNIKHVVEMVGNVDHGTTYLVLVVMMVEGADSSMGTCIGLEPMLLVDAKRTYSNQMYQ